MDKKMDKLAQKITNLIGTMWTAIVFTIISLVALPAAIESRNAIIIVAWLSQAFLQLVLLPIIMVGQNVNSRKTEQQISETHDAVMKELKIAMEERREIKQLLKKNEIPT